MRSEIRTINGKQVFVVFAYMQNPSSLKVSLETFKSLNWENTALVIGDMFELGEEADVQHRAIVDLIIALGFDEAYLVENINKPITRSKDLKPLLIYWIIFRIAQQ